MATKRLASLIVMLLVFVAIPAELQARCPSPSTSMCPARCSNYFCNLDSNPCMLCTYVGSEPNGCASMANCPCCELMPLF